MNNFFEEIPFMEGNQKFFRPSDLYPLTLKNIDSLTPDEQDRVLENLKQVEWIKTFIQEELKPEEHEIFKQTILSKLESPEMPLHLMSLSAMIYNLKNIGIDVSELEFAVNSSNRVRQEIENMIRFKHLQN